MREFDLTLEFKLLEVQEEAFAVAEAAAAAEASDVGVIVWRTRSGIQYGRCRHDLYTRLSARARVRW